MTNKNKLNGLAIDGGGIRGYIVLKQLKALEKALGGSIIDHFQYLGLNSTSGIIGGLLAIGYSASDAEAFYEKHGEKIFHKKPLKLGLFKPKYDVKYFEDTLEKIFKDIKLSDLKTNIIVSATNYTDRYEKELVFLFKSEKAKIDSTKDFYLKDVVRATTAAPIYFKPHKITSVDGKTTLLLGDGGLCVNNPSYMMFVDMEDNPLENKEINVLSFTTGKKIPSITKQLKTLEELEENAALKNVDDIVDIQLDANQYIADYNMTHAKKHNRCNIYYRLKSYINYSNGKIDDASEKNMRYMAEDGERSANLNRLVIKSFVENIK